MRSIDQIPKPKSRIVLYFRRIIKFQEKQTATGNDARKEREKTNQRLEGIVRRQNARENRGRRDGDGVERISGSVEDEA